MSNYWAIPLGLFAAAIVVAIAWKYLLPELLKNIDDEGRGV